MTGKSKNQYSRLICLIILLIIAIVTGAPDVVDRLFGAQESGTAVTFSLPEYNNDIFVMIDDGIPDFGDEITSVGFEYYSELDRLGRCGVVTACVGRETMPTEKRESISGVKPTGWHSVEYDIIKDRSLYNRCHLIGFQLTGENANERNLITGTRYFNTEGMLPFENMVADYVKETNNHVMYRVTPVFVDNELVARGVRMEAYSVEDDGDGVCFDVFVFNIQPGIEIDYLTGESALAE